MFKQFHSCIFGYIQNWLGFGFKCMHALNGSAAILPFRQPAAETTMNMNVKVQCFGVINQYASEIY